MDNQKTKRELLSKLNLIKTEIADKEAEIKKLRTANAKLIELNLGKERKPPSLKQQRDNITKLDLEILELKLVEKSLNEKLQDTDNAIRQDLMKNKISQFNETSKDQLCIVETVRRNLNALERSLAELDNVSNTSSALYGLLRILFDSPEAKQYIDLSDVLKNWSVSNLNLQLPLNIETKLSQFNNQIYNLWNQLNAVHTGSRTVPSSKIPKQVGNISQVGTQNDWRNKMAAQDAVERAKNKVVSEEDRNPNTVKHIPDQNPNIPVLERR